MRSRTRIPEGNFCSAARCPFRYIRSRNPLRYRASHDSDGTASELVSTSSSESARDSHTTVLPSLSTTESLPPPYPLQQSEEERSRLWKAAVKIPMYWVAVIPPLVGVAAAYYDTGFLPFLQTGQLMLGSICIIAWLNLSNDVYDSATGVDVNKKESIVSLTNNRKLIHLLSISFLAAGVMVLLSAARRSGSISAIARLGAAIACGYVYQGPPFRLGYKGLGEPLCFVAFGPLATTAFYLLVSNGVRVSTGCWAASILVGWTTSLVLFCSHFHQYDSDKAVNKLSPVVRLGGVLRSQQVLSITMLCFFATVVAMTMTQTLPLLLVPLSTVPALLANRCVRFGRNNLHKLSKLRFLKLYALDVHASYGISLCVTFIAARLL